LDVKCLQLNAWCVSDPRYPRGVVDGCDSAGCYARHANEPKSASNAQAFKVPFEVRETCWSSWCCAFMTSPGCETFGMPPEIYCIYTVYILILHKAVFEDSWAKSGLHVIVFQWFMQNVYKTRITSMCLFLLDRAGCPSCVTYTWPLVTLNHRLKSPGPSLWTAAGHSSQELTSGMLF